MSASQAQPEGHHPSLNPSAHTDDESARAARDLVARVILMVCAAGAVIATATTIGDVVDAEGALQSAETWRLAGLPVFAALFVILARSPRSIPWLWEVVIANKLWLVLAGATYLSGVDGSRDFLYADAFLAVCLGIAYILTRGWSAWIKKS